MLNSLLSSGAQRVLDRLLLKDPCTAVDLLESLWIDESRAHEYLKQVGLTDKHFEQVAGPSAPSTLPPWPVSEFLRGAQQLTVTEDRDQEIRTEHLLMSALDIPDFFDLLDRLKLDASGLRTRLLSPIAAATTPIETEVQLRPAAVTQQASVDVSRILDASANRCREGLRVVEDYARMILNDGHLARRIKEVRHSLAPLLSYLHLDDAVRARDTEHDVGTSIHTTFEMARPSAWSVAIANLKRVQEALRTLEEYGKTIDPRAAAEIGQLRYQFYTIEKGLFTTQGAIERLSDCQLYLLVTDELCPRGAGPVVKAAIKGGVDIIQLREKTLTDRRFLELAKWVREWTAEAGVLLIVNDRPDLACLADADGVHVGQGDLTVHEARKIVGGQKLVGVSTHAIEQARQAVMDGADYLGMGPVFTSRTKSFESFAGLEYVTQLTREIALPSFAIGGITASNVSQVLAAGARRVAVSSEICQAEDPERMTAELKESLVLHSQSMATGQ
ncbi:MAG: thiamine phosphate synthase [Planctomycetaceae bacterium]